MVTIRHGWLGSQSHRLMHPRPDAYGRALWVTEPSGGGRRYEFDYDHHNFYVYVGFFSANGYMSHYGPVRTIPRRKGKAT